MSIIQSIRILEVLVDAEVGLNASELVRLIPDMTRGQIVRLTKQMVGEGFIEEIAFNYRNTVTSKKYVVNEHARNTFAGIARRWDEHPHPVEMIFDLTGQPVQSQFPF